MSKKNKILFILFICAAVTALGIWGFSSWVEHYNSSSRSDSYTTKERYENNCAMDQIIHQRTDDYDALTTVTVIDSAYAAFGETRTTYNVTVYVVNEDALAVSGYTLDSLQAAGPSDAADAVRSGVMMKAATAVIRMDIETNSVLSFSMEALM